MERKVLLGERYITYELERKRIKNINLRIRHNKTVYVSMPFGASDKFADDFVRSKADWIFKQIAFFDSCSKSNLNISNGEKIKIFGNEYTLLIRESKEYIRGIDGEYFLLSLPYCNDEIAVKNYLRKTLKEMLFDALIKISKEVYEEHFKDLNIDFPEIKVRKMKARWGSCHVEKKTVIFNEALVFVPHKCIEYVVCHEFVHFIHPDHSKRFYGTLGTIFPDWKQAKNMIRTYPNAFEGLF